MNRKFRQIRGTFQRTRRHTNVDMSRLLLALFAILAIFSVSAMGDEGGACPQNEIWNPCGTACPPTCRNPRPICTLQCVPSCQCAEGMVRNNSGKCIPKSRCAA